MKSQMIYNSVPTTYYLIIILAIVSYLYFRVLANRYNYYVVRDVPHVHEH